MHASEVEIASKPAAPALAAMPTSSTEHSAGELDRHQHPPPLTAAAAAVVKRKRTKRPRHHPPAAAAASSSASSSESTTTEEEDMAHCLILLAQGAGAAAAAHAAAVVVDSKPSPSQSLAPQQQQQTPAIAAAPPPAVRSERYTSRKYTEAAATADGVKAGFYVYECKTCNKCFPTFQALGGHRASHKKPRLAGAGADDEIAAGNVITTAATIKLLQQQKPPAPAASPAAPLLRPHQIDIAAVFPDVTTALSLNNGGGVAMGGGGGAAKLRVHECSICGAEFASGQALGGHMRRHRPLNAPERAVAAIAGAAADTKKEGSACINLELDLNLPAPSDEEAVPPPSLPVPAAAAPAVVLGQFSDGKKGGLVLTASALVDCHY